MNQEKRSPVEQDKAKPSAGSGDYPATPGGQSFAQTPAPIPRKPRPWLFYRGMCWRVASIGVLQGIPIRSQASGGIVRCNDTPWRTLQRSDVCATGCLKGGIPPDRFQIRGRMRDGLRTSAQSCAYGRLSPIYGLPCLSHGANLRHPLTAMSVYRIIMRLTTL